MPNRPSRAKHHPYLQQGVINFFMEQGNNAFGNRPWRVHTLDLRQIELYFQGGRVTLAPYAQDTVRVIPR